MPTSVNSPASTRKSCKEKARNCTNLCLQTLLSRAQNSAKQCQALDKNLTFSDLWPWAPPLDLVLSLTARELRTATPAQPVKTVKACRNNFKHQHINQSTILRLRKAFHYFLWSLSRFSLFQRPLATLIRATEALGQNGTHQRAYKLRLQL